VVLAPYRGGASRFKLKKSLTAAEMQQDRDQPPPSSGHKPVDAAPIFNVPIIVVIVIGMLTVSHLAISILPPRSEVLAQSYGAVSPKLFLSGPSAYGGMLMMIAPLFTHIFIHANLMHLLLNSVWLLAFGAPVARRLNAGQSEAAAGLLFLLLFVLSGVAGALAYIMAHPSEYTLLVGASGSVSGLLGGLVRFAFHRPMQDGRAFAPLTDRKVIVWSVVILALNFAVGLLGGLLVGGGNDIAWEAHVGGYVFGLLTFPLFDARHRSS
jgi:membrane associated rhomboid family serine protease